jgi:hypothetical protein
MQVQHKRDLVKRVSWLFIIVGFVLMATAFLLALYIEGWKGIISALFCDVLGLGLVLTYTKTSKEE